MPVQRVVKDKQVGYKWGTSGHVYYGPGAEAKARLQGRAILAAGYKEPGVTSSPKK